MARARNIKPSFFKNEQLVELPYDRRLLFIGLWMLADREGRLEDRPKRIKMEVFPGDDVNVDRALDELAKAGFIVRYTVGENRFIEVLAFLKHQNPHHREPPSTIPKPEAGPPFKPPSLIPPKPEALPTCQPAQSPRLDDDESGGEPEASPSPAEERHGLALLNPDSGFLNPDSGINTLSGKTNDDPPDDPGEPDDPDPKAVINAEARGVIEFLNARAGRSFQPTESQLKFIRGRMSEGVTVEQLRAVVDCKVKQWLNDPEYSKYLRPETLFNATKFPSYLAEAVSQASPPQRRAVV